MVPMYLQLQIFHFVAVTSIVGKYLQLQLTSTINGANVLATTNIPFVAVTSIVGKYLQLQLTSIINGTNKCILLTLNTLHLVRVMHFIRQFATPSPLGIQSNVLLASNTMLKYEICMM